MAIAKMLHHPRPNPPLTADSDDVSLRRRAHRRLTFARQERDQMGFIAAAPKTYIVAVYSDAPALSARAPAADTDAWSPQGAAGSPYAHRPPPTTPPPASPAAGSVEALSGRLTEAQAMVTGLLRDKQSLDGALEEARRHLAARESEAAALRAELADARRAAAAAAAAPPPPRADHGPELRRAEAALADARREAEAEGRTRREAEAAAAAARREAEAEGRARREAEAAAAVARREAEAEGRARREAEAALEQEKGRRGAAAHEADALKVCGRAARRCSLCGLGPEYCISRRGRASWRRGWGSGWN
jgi:multidrug efflux pump subunit AcrA (membrane-fusion protein)